MDDDAELAARIDAVECAMGVLAADLRAVLTALRSASAARPSAPAE